MNNIEKITIPERSDHERIHVIKNLFPEAISDGKIDIKKLESILNLASENDKGTAYGIYWPGKENSRRLAFMPTNQTLIPDKYDFGSDQKSFLIEGENLEVLKTLVKSYSNSIDMIYIDPPYNTGKDMVYVDDFNQSTRDYLSSMGKFDEVGALESNPKSGGRFHTKWLNMIYPRLLVSRELIADGGFIFVSIDENEVNNLRLVMDEIFGEENFVAQMVWHSEGHTDNQFAVKVVHEYILIYSKDTSISRIGNVVDPNTRRESNLWQGFAENSITKNGPANPPSEIKLPSGFPCAMQNGTIKSNLPQDEFFDDVSAIGYITRDVTRAYEATYPIRYNDITVSDGLTINDCTIYSGWANRNKLLSFINNGCKPLAEDGGTLRFYLSERGVVYYVRERNEARNIVSVLRNFSTTEMARSRLENIGVKFQYPKPIDLISYLIRMGTGPDGLILDFFAGSGTTAAAVAEVNKEFDSNRRFILVQSSENTKIDSPERASGFNRIIDITKLRLEKEPSIGNLNHIGFLKLGKSQFSLPKQLKLDSGGNVLFPTPQIVKDTGSSILEILLLEGFPLDAKIEQAPEFEDQVYFATHPDRDHRLIICVTPDPIADQTVERARRYPKDTFICFEESLSDQNKIRLADAVAKVKTL